MIRNIVALGALLFIVVSCKPDDPAPSDIGGKGGNGILKVTPRHHGTAIDSCTVYIKYNATDAPGDKRYDDSAKCIPSGGIPVATFSGLKKGNYYLYGLGWDPSLTPPQAVKGAFAYNLTSQSVESIDLGVVEF